MSVTSFDSNAAPLLGRASAKHAGRVRSQSAQDEVEGEEAGAGEEGSEGLTIAAVNAHK